MKVIRKCGSCGKDFDITYENITYGNSFILASLEKGLRYICIRCVMLHENANQVDQHQSSNESEAANIDECED